MTFEEAFVTVGIIWLIFILGGLIGWAINLAHKLFCGGSGKGLRRW
jgi:hypothetical protein